MDWGLLLFAAPTLAPKGGTAIIIPIDSVHVPKKSTYSNELKAIKASVQRLPSGRGIKIDTKLEGHTIRLVSAYAPPDSLAHQRPAFFTTHLPRLTNNHTVLGIDANCVPNEQLDLHRAGTSPYNNAGATELNQLMADHELIDVARACLGSKRFYTSHHNIGGGATTSTRIDQIYAPDINGITWSHVPVQRELFPIPPQAKELDHCMIEITIATIKTKKGSDLKTIDESIYENLTFNHKLATAIKQILLLHNPGVLTSWRHTWNTIKTRVRDMSLAETRKKKKKDSKALAKLKHEQHQIKARIDKGNTKDTPRYIELLEEINRKSKQERSLHQSLEDIAYNRGKQHDTGGAAFHRSFKPKGAAHWIEEIFHADWTDTMNPVRPPQHTSCKDPKLIAAAATPYWKSLFTRKPTDPIAYHKNLDTLKQGHKVCPPHRSQMQPTH